MALTAVLVTIVVILVIIILASAIKIVPEYQRAVLFRLGRLLGPRGPGLVIIIPIVDRIIRVDLRTVTLDVPPQEAITKDNVPVKVNAVVYFRVLDPALTVVKVANYILATSQIAQTTLRSVLGQADLDHLLTEREKINMRLQEIIDEQTDPWGIKVSIVEIKDVEIPQTMQRAMAIQAESERQRRGKVIAAEGEFQASEKLALAAQVLTRTPASIQLRYLQTLVEIASEKNSTVIFPVPIDILQNFFGHRGAPEPEAQNQPVKLTTAEVEALAESNLAPEPLDLKSFRPPLGEDVAPSSEEPQ
jgi:regulator of protease activity HflC (stomatin/prohibitin superfamily)